MCIKDCTMDLGAVGLNNNGNYINNDAGSCVCLPNYTL
jgi:hypothetical protein